MSQSQSSRRVSVGVGLAVALLLLVAALLAGGGAPQAAPAGIPDPGLLTGWALPVMALLSDVLAVGVAAGFLFPLLSTDRVATGRMMGRLSGARLAGRLAAVWLVVLLVWSWLQLSDQLAVPPGELGWTEWSGFMRHIPQGQAIVWQLALVSVIALTARWAATFGQVFALLVVTVLTFAPRVLTGHSSSSGNHDLALVFLALHVTAVLLWVGGVFALWFHLAEKPEKRELAAHRFGYLAGFALVVVAFSGLVSAYVRVGRMSAFLTSGYGALSLVKAAALLVLVGLALRVRRNLGADLDSRIRFARLAGVELLVMGAAIALGAALNRTAPPVGDPYVSTAESLIGGPLPPAPTPARLAWSYEPSGVGLMVVVGGALMYLVALVAIHRRGGSWPWWRTLAWFFGLLVVGYATFGGLGAYSHVLFSAHMAAHMLLSMLAPIFLVLGAPITLLLRALPGGRPGADGPRQVLSWLLRTPVSRAATNPFFVVPLFLVSLYGVYFTGFFNDVMLNHAGHAWMQAHFLISGYLLFELVVGSDPVPFQLPPVARLLLMLGLAPFHAFFAISVADSTTVIGGEFYRLLERPYRSDLLADQEYAGQFVWAFGELPTLIVGLALLGLWFVKDSRQAKRHDRREDAAGEDSELAAYNEWLKQLGTEVQKHDR